MTNLHSHIWILIIFLVSSCISCSTSTNPTKKENKDSFIEERNEALPLPSIPDSISDPVERVRFAAEHFWDGLEAVDDAARRDTAFMEQSFANFAAILQYADSAGARSAVNSFIDRCAADEDLTRLGEWIAWKYLDEPNSPMRNEDLYILFLQGYNSQPDVPADLKAKASARLETALKNRPGMLASDFSLTTRDGNFTTLHALASHDTTLVIFYDPECDHCKEITGRIADVSASIPYPVLAINVEDNLQAWDDGKWSFPDDWTVGMATESLEDRELYHFPALPALYLLAPGGKVVLKDFQLRL